MRIINIMLGRGRGGIEQAFLDYTPGLHAAGGNVISVIRPGAAIAEDLQRQQFSIYELPHLGAWDCFASWRLRRWLQLQAPDIVIAHGNRALALARRATRSICPLVGVAHNYSIAGLRHADAVFAITKHLAQTIEDSGIPASRIHHIPNMIAAPRTVTRPALRQPPVIGSMGRFVKKKGFDVWIEALAQLHSRGVAFTALLGGSGEEESSLKALAAKKGVDSRLRFTGWVEDKAAFFQSIDLFCLPSLHEPFGIVLLEAFAAQVPVVTTNSEGPSEIATHGQDAWIVPAGDANALADGMVRVLNDATLRTSMTSHACTALNAHYTVPVVSKKIWAALETIIAAPRYPS